MMTDMRTREIGELSGVEGFFSDHPFSILGEVGFY